MLVHGVVLLVLAAGVGAEPLVDDLVAVAVHAFALCDQRASGVPAIRRF